MADVLPGAEPSRADPPCLIRGAEFCSLCFPGASGPDDCGLMYLVMTDPDLRERLLHGSHPASAVQSAN